MRLNLVPVLLLLVIALQTDGTLMTVTVFYETFDAISATFFYHQLKNAYTSMLIRKYVYFELVPFGLARKIPKSVAHRNWDIFCDHGPQECLANTFHSCFFDAFRCNAQQVRFTICTMTVRNPLAFMRQCFDKLNYAKRIAYEDLSKCAMGDLGLELQQVAANRTLNFKPPVTRVPTVVFDNEYNPGIQHWALTDLKTLILKYLDRICQAALSPNSTEEYTVQKKDKCRKYKIDKTPKITMADIALKAIDCKDKIKAEDSRENEVKKKKNEDKEEKDEETGRKSFWDYLDVEFVNPFSL